MRTHREAWNINLLKFNKLHFVKKQENVIKHKEQAYYDMLITICLQYQLYNRPLLESIQQTRATLILFRVWFL